VRGAEGTAVARPGRSSDNAWSEGSKNYFRNVEAEGSNAHPVPTYRRSGQSLTLTRRISQGLSSYFGESTTTGGRPS
jgi:hypothetical protein